MKMLRGLCPGSVRSYLILGKLETKEFLKGLTLFKLVFTSSLYFAEHAFSKGTRRVEPKPPQRFNQCLERYKSASGSRC